jgi:queuine tRNA-ribosyltransferase
MPAPGTFTLLAVDGAARTGRLRTAHGIVETPIFMPVGTAGSVKAVAPDDLAAVGAEIILANTYHLYLRPGHGTINALGGLHAFCGWEKPILTDSGGYQVFSLSALRTVREEGVIFRSHLDGSRHLFTPETVIDIQLALGSDIMMPLDECLPHDAPREKAAASLALTTRWAERSRARWPGPGIRGEHAGMLFGIVQGGMFTDLRMQAVERLLETDFDGYGIGGLSVGESKAEMLDVLAATLPLLPSGKARYLMGVGTPLDIVRAVGLGVDMFDCVLPTRDARNGTLFTSLGRINIKRREYAGDASAPDPACSCYTCRTFSRAYLRHLFTGRELLAHRLNSIHNLAYFLHVTQTCRQAVREGTFAAYLRHMETLYDS